MLVSEIKSRFYTEYDEYESDYISPAKLNYIFWHAQTAVFDNNLIPSYQSTKRISEDLIPLKNTETITGLSSNLVTLSSITEYNSFISAIPTYVVDGVTYTWPATELLDVDISSVYAQGTLRYPKYQQYTNSSGDSILDLRPINLTPTQVLITYFRNFYPIDFNSPSDDIPYTSNAIMMVLEQAKQIAAEAFRDPDFFNTSSAMLQQDKTPNV